MERETKKKRDVDEKITEKNMKFMRYLPDPVQKRLSSLERLINTNNISLMTMIGSIQEKNAEGFDECFSDIHDFYRGLNSSS